jgi:hypothetical protein
MYFILTEILRNGTTNKYSFESEMEYKNYIALSRQYAPYNGYKHLIGAQYRIECVMEYAKTK